MSCCFCYCTFKSAEHLIESRRELSLDHSLRIIEALAKFGFKKITFAGGEPTMCPWLLEAVRGAQQLGFVTGIVTNGSLLNEDWILAAASSLDWLALSIDSANAEIHKLQGRFVPGRPLSNDRYIALANVVRENGIRLKVNTVVTRNNVEEDMSSLISAICPQRWKIFQVLPIRNENADDIDNLAVLPSELNRFVDRHALLSVKGISLVPETNVQMSGSYVIVDPTGRFIDNSDGIYRYSTSILERGVKNALAEVSVDYALFINRGGLYDW